MANFYQLAVTGIPNLAAIIKAYKSTVVLSEYETFSQSLASTTQGIIASATATAAGAVGGAGVVIYVDTYREIANSDVSYQLIMAKEGDKKWVSDNVAPQPRTWQFSGYITAISIMEPIALYGYTLLTKKKQLMDMRQSRKAIWLKTIDSELVLVTIPELEFAPTGEVGNALPLTMKLQELIVLQTTGNDNPATPPAGTTASQPVDIGNVPSSTTTTLPPGISGGAH
jgi:hypothetical protein